ncbi:MAG TPA: hypothetical protein VIT66_08575 [Lysobacter sp.]|jgi:hypothetical protein
MNIFTNLLFLQGYLADPHLFDEDDDRYSRGYGNRAASDEFFTHLGHAKGEVQDAGSASNRNAECTADGCA